MNAGSIEEALRLADIKPGGDLPTDLDDGRVCYWKGPKGRWWVYLPRAGIGQLVNHSVTEHEDGTITVSPSIGLHRGGKGLARHGFLIRGKWREV